jgi:hypothetical protein
MSIAGRERYLKPINSSVGLVGETVYGRSDLVSEMSALVLLL